MPWKPLLGGIASLLALVSYYPYLRDLSRQKTKPHTVSWLIWFLVTAISFAGQTLESAGPGAWVTGVNSLCCCSIFLFSLKYGERRSSGYDLLCLLLALLAILLWASTSNPLWAVGLATIIDALGFVPTFIKSFHRPFEETIETYAISAGKFFISLFALERFSFVTVLYPSSLVITNSIFVAMVLWRRKQLRSPVNASEL